MEKNKKIKNKIISVSLKIATVFVAVFLMKNTVFGADDPLSVINNLSTFIFAIIRAIGMILLGWGIVQIGLALKSHDPSQRANRIYDISRWSYYNICKGNFRPNYWRIK